MTEIYFVRHCQPKVGWKQDDALRPLTAQGKADCAEVTRALRDVKLDACACSTFLRSYETIRGCAEEHGLSIQTDPRFGERHCGPADTDAELVKRWADLDYHEEGGESIRMVQARNLEALREVLRAHADQRVLLGTHGTALSSMLAFYEPEFRLNGYLALRDRMPYVLRAVFEGDALVEREDVFFIERGYYGEGSERA